MSFRNLRKSLLNWVLIGFGILFLNICYLDVSNRIENYNEKDSLSTDELITEVTNASLAQTRPLFIVPFETDETDNFENIRIEIQENNDSYIIYQLKCTYTRTENKIISYVDTLGNISDFRIDNELINAADEYEVKSGEHSFQMTCKSAKIFEDETLLGVNKVVDVSHREIADSPTVALSNDLVTKYDLTEGMLGTLSIKEAEKEQTVESYFDYIFDLNGFGWFTIGYHIVLAIFEIVICTLGSIEKRKENEKNKNKVEDY